MALHVLVALHYLAEISLLAGHCITVSELLAGTVDVNAVVRQYCRNAETEDQARMYQFMRDLTACRDWYDRDSGCILSRDEFLSVSRIFHYSVLCDVYDFIINNNDFTMTQPHRMSVCCE